MRSVYAVMNTEVQGKTLKNMQIAIQWKNEHPNIRSKQSYGFILILTNLAH